MSAEWKDFLPGVSVDVMGCPRAVMLDYIRRAAIEFCRETRILRKTLDPITIVAGTREYAIATPTGTVMVTVIQDSGRIDGNYIAGPVDINTLTDTATGPIDRWALTNDNRLVVWPTPTDAGTFLLDATLKPSRAADTCDDILLEDWSEGIEALAKYRLLRMPNKSWSEPNAAQGFYATYRRERSKARNKAIRQGRTSLRAKYRRLGDQRGWPVTVEG